MDDRERIDLVMKAIAAAADNDADTAAEAFNTVGENSTPSQMYGVACALAEAAKVLLDKLIGPLPDGSMYALDQLTPGAELRDPAQLFAVRFIVANANRDKDTRLALFSTAHNATPDDYVDSLMALLCTTGNFMRLAEANKASQN